jgi:transposase
LTEYLREYREGGLEALKILAFRRPRSDLDDHRASLEAYFREHPPASVKEAMAKIEELTGLKRSPDRVRAFLKRIGMKCRKVGMIPAKANVEAQEDFKKNSSSRAWRKPKPDNAWFFSSMPRTSF